MYADSCCDIMKLKAFDNVLATVHAAFIKHTHVGGSRWSWVKGRRLT